jgi:hypothetical protein
MVLLVADPGPLRAAVEAGLRQAGEDVVVRSPADEDLWLAARGGRAVVYLPGSSLLDANLAPSPSVERVAEVLAAAGAPGVEVLVPVFPDHPGFALELDAVELVRRAAEVAGRPLPVRPLRPWLFRALRGLGRWLRRREATLLSALAPLLPELAPPSRRRALPPARAPA